MTRVMTLSAFVCLVMSACQQGAPDGFPGADPPPQGGDPPSAETSDPIESFRRDLADPAKYDVRSGGQLQRDALQAAITEFAAANRALLDERFDASVEALEEGAPPSAPELALRLEVEDPRALEAAAVIAWLVQTLNPDVQSVARRTITTLLPSAAREQGFTTSELAMWLTFFATAEPTWRRCGGTGDVLVVCADYGGLDIFVVRLEHTLEPVPEFPGARSAWAPRALQWWQHAP